jgi:hypothetical protein
MISQDDTVKELKELLKESIKWHKDSIDYQLPALKELVRKIEEATNGK